MTTRITLPLRSGGLSLRDMLVQDGLDEESADLLLDLPNRVMTADQRRPFREFGSSRDELILVRSGLLTKYKTDGQGRRQIVALRFPGEAILPRETESEYGIHAITESELQIVDSHDFEEVLDHNPALSRHVRRITLRHMAIAYEWLVNTGRRDTTARVAHLLCEMAVRMRIDPEHEALLNPFTQLQIADITGQTSVNVNRVFSALEREALIKRDGRHIHFPNWMDLRRLASFQADYLN